MVGLPRRIELQDTMAWQHGEDGDAPVLQILAQHRLTELHMHRRDVVDHHTQQRVAQAFLGSQEVVHGARVVVTDHRQTACMAAGLASDTGQVWRGQVDDVALAQVAGAFHDQHVVLVVDGAIGIGQALGEAAWPLAHQQRLDALGSQLHWRQSLQWLQQAQHILHEDYVLIEGLAGLQDGPHVDWLHIAHVDAVIAHAQPQADAHRGLAGIGFGG
jgi:hypothetical protein